jgi:hypothetical protein
LLDVQAQAAQRQQHEVEASLNVLKGHVDQLKGIEVRGYGVDGMWWQ